ncbi:CBO0543 family protein [Paenibacillus sp. P36]|uniref:CBO0543 family protein n=1 Tax=Paenibacillus sp. P36 TaxID=3342538 RepID=UPI0038B31876
MRFFFIACKKNIKLYINLEILFLSSHIVKPYEGILVHNSKQFRWDELALNTLDQDYEKISDLQSQLIHLKINFWIQYDLFKLHWWILLIVTILPWLIWWKYVDRSKFNILITYGLLWMILSILLDDIGIALGLWQYPLELFSFVPPLFPADITILPITYMLIFQYFPKKSSFLIATLSSASLFSYIIEPIFISFNLYRPSNNWKHYYTLIVIIILSYTIKWITIKLQDHVDHNQTNHLKRDQ